MDGCVLLRGQLLHCAATDAPVVSCTPCGAVVGLSLDNNNLVGQIEDSSGAIWDVMESLEFINLQGDCF